MSNKFILAAFAYACIHINLNVCIYVYEYFCIYICMSVLTYICMKNESILTPFPYAFIHI